MSQTLKKPKHLMHIENIKMKEAGPSCQVATEEENP